MITFPILKHLRGFWSKKPMRLEQTSVTLAEKILFSTSNAVLVVNSTGSIIYSSQGHFRDLEWGVIDLIGSNVLNLFGPNDKSLVQKIFLAARSDETSSTPVMAGRVEILNKNKVLVFAHMSVSFFEWQNERHSYISLRPTDLDDLELRLAQEQATELKKTGENKSRFLSHMSHEIRSPLNSMLGMVDLLALTPLTPQQRDYLLVLKKNSRHLRALIKDVLDLSKIEAGMVETENIPFDLADLLTDVLQSNKTAAIEKGLSLKLESDLTHKSWIGDPHRLIQIINNLVNNAIKFTASGDVTIFLTCSAAMTKEDTVRLTIAVSDTGIGMSQTRQGEIFNEYKQGAKSVSRHYGGSGLGLFITKELVKLMGGEISVHSQSGKGTTFEFSVNLQPSYSDQAFMDTAPPQNLGALAGTRVLIVDDDLTNQVLLQAWLAPAEIQVVCVSNGQEALDELAKEERFDAVLMDISMPVMNGLTATAHIRRVLPTDPPDRQRYLGSLPIIGITGHALSEDLDRCLAAGMVDSLTKPLSRTTVLEKLTSVMRAKDAIQMGDW